MADKNPTIEALLSENRRFKPDKAFTANANIKDPEIYERANADPEKFWSQMAEELDWFKKWDTVLDCAVTVLTGKMWDKSKDW